MMSLNLAERVPRCASGRVVQEGGGPALLAQVRVWHRGLVGKGMLVTNGQLPPGYLVLPESMIKVFARPEAALGRAAEALKRDVSAFEVIRTSNGAVAGRMNPQLVPLLEYAGDDRMVPLLMAMQSTHASKVAELGSSELSANQLRHLLMELGLSDGQLGASAADMLLAGFEPQAEPHLRKKVVAVMRDALERVASGRFTVPLSTSLMGVPDYTGSVPEGEVVVIEEGKYIQEEILLYRNPGTHIGDIRKVRASLPTPELLQTFEGISPELVNGVIFSTRGPRALADMLSGGDYDGDEFLYFKSSLKLDIGTASDPPLSLVDAFKGNSPPWEPPPPPPAQLGQHVHPLHPPPPPQMVTEDADAVQVMLCRNWRLLDEASGKIGAIAVVLQMAQEKCGAGHHKALRLVDLYNAALDAPKSGADIGTEHEEIKNELLFHPPSQYPGGKGYPCFMS